MHCLVEAVPPQSHKFVVNSTIIQHARLRSSDKEADSTSRGMHAASGALWNSDKDGMWSFRYDPEGKSGEKRGFDVVVNIVWIAT